MEALIRALQAINEYHLDSEDTQVLKAKARGLIRGYHARWSSENYQIQSVENTVMSDLHNPETGRSSRSFRLAGKVDATMIDDAGNVVLMDHKTCSEDIADPGSPYWRQLIVEAQPTTYMLLEWLNGRKVDYAIWDVVRKPSISPRQITKAERAEISARGTWFGDFAEPLERESPEMYEARLAWDSRYIRPEWYFQRRTVARLESSILEHAQDIWQHGQDMLVERKQSRHVPNAKACMLYKSPCKFLGICSGFDSPDSENWGRKKQVHSELTLIGDGRDILTNSRIASFQTCRRKHYFEYELGLERVDAEEREALQFGTLWHIALETWLNTQKENQIGNSSDTAFAAAHV